MAYRLTGLGGFGFNANWEKTPGDLEVARRLVAYLEDRRVLFGDRHSEDEIYCVRSALDARTKLTELISAAKPGKGLESALKQMRSHFRHFVERAGPDARDFRGRWGGSADASPFGIALGELRSGVGIQLAAILTEYPIEIEPDLARILPPPEDDGQDLSWLPWFNDQG